MSSAFLAAVTAFCQAEWEVKVDRLGLFVNVIVIGTGAESAAAFASSALLSAALALLYAVWNLSVFDCNLSTRGQNVCMQIQAR